MHMVFNFYEPNEGSIIGIIINTEIFRGIVLLIDDGSETVNKYCEDKILFNKYFFENIDNYFGIRYNFYIFILLVK